MNWNCKQFVIMAFVKQNVNRRFISLMQVLLMWNCTKLFSSPSNWFDIRF